ncbi:hypothetical protein D3C85_1808690 [compost metagenome]
MLVHIHRLDGLNLLQAANDIFLTGTKKLTTNLQTTLLQELVLRRKRTSLKLNRCNLA